MKQQQRQQQQKKSPVINDDNDEKDVRKKPKNKTNETESGFGIYFVWQSDMKFT